MLLNWSVSVDLRQETSGFEVKRAYRGGELRVVYHKSSRDMSASWTN